MSLDAGTQSGERLARLLHTESLLGQLYQALENELKAVARCDFDEIARIGASKEKLVGTLEDAAGSPFGDQSEDELFGGSEMSKEEHAIQKRVTLAAGQVRAMMRANSALLGEAIAVISAKLGIDSSVQSYDRRARTVGRTRRPSSKSI